jgi:Zn-dependent protease with chaperone function
MTSGEAPGFGDLSASPEVALAMEEYRTVRQEELVALQSQISTLRYGVTGCVVLIGVAAQQHADKYLGWAIALALVPLVVLFSAVIWMGEYERMARAGHYISGLEGRINDMVANGAWRPLRWETWLREGGNMQSRIVGGHHRYLTIACVFIAFQVASVAMGLHFYWHQHAKDPSREWLIPIAVAVNAGILLTLLGYFRSSYERLRDYTVEPEEHTWDVRQRFRMRLKLYAILGAVAFISAPFYSWPIGFAVISGIEYLGWLKHIPVYWAASPSVIWMALIPLIASRAVMRELLGRRLLREEPVSESERAGLARKGLLRQLTDWEQQRLRLVKSDELNAPSIGRSGHVTVTTDAVVDEDGFVGALAHEIGHHRLHHLYPLTLCYLYFWPYLYFDERVSRRSSNPDEIKLRKAARVARRVFFSVLALPGWLAWLVLRWGWRTAEYDADRFAYLSGKGEALTLALRRHEQIRLEKRPKRWQDRIVKGWERRGQWRALGYLPVPNEHPIPRRRLKHLDEWRWIEPEVERTR